MASTRSTSFRLIDEPDNGDVPAWIRATTNRCIYPASFLSLPRFSLSLPIPTPVFELFWVAASAQLPPYSNTLERSRRHTHTHNNTLRQLDWRCRTTCPASHWLLHLSTTAVNSSSSIQCLPSPSRPNSKLAPVGSSEFTNHGAALGRRRKPAMRENQTVRSWI